MLKSEIITGYGGITFGYTVVERHIQDYFFEHLNEFLPNAKRVIRKDIAGDDRRGIPDGWVMWYGVLCPVEVKQRTFGCSAADQIELYMKNYGCSHGIAVAERFAVSKRPDITYITIPVDRSLEAAHA